jgi:hypothetical protein
MILIAEINNGLEQVAAYSLVLLNQINPYKP